MSNRQRTEGGGHDKLSNQCGDETQNRITPNIRLKILSFFMPKANGEFQDLKLRGKFLEQLKTVLKNHHIIGEDFNMSNSTIKLEGHFDEFRIIDENDETYTISVTVPYRLKYALIDVLHNDSEGIEPTHIRWHEEEEEKKDMFIPIVIQVPKQNFTIQDIKILKDNVNSEPNKITSNISKEALINMAKVKLNHVETLFNKLQHFSLQEIVDILTIHDSIIEKIDALSHYREIVKANNKEIIKLQTEFGYEENKIDEEDLQEYIQHLNEQIINYSQDINKALTYIRKNLANKVDILPISEVYKQLEQARIIKNAYDHKYLFSTDFSSNERVNTELTHIVNTDLSTILENLPTNILKCFIDINIKDLNKIFTRHIGELQEEYNRITRTIQTQKHIIDNLLQVIQAQQIMQIMIAKHKYAKRQEVWDISKQ